MKKLILVILLLSSSNLFAQELSWIYLKNGDIIKGKIIETVPEVSIKVELKGGSIINYQLSEVLRIQTIPISKTGSLGVGLGIPYGILGVNGEFTIGANVTLTGGVGTTILAVTGYNFGIKYYLKEIGNTWRPRISAYYGTNGILAVKVLYWSTREDIEEVHNGLTLGIGQQWMWGDTKSHGLDLDFMYIISSGIYDRIDELKSDMGLDIEKPGRFKLSIGYRYGF